MAYPRYQVSRQFKKLIRTAGDLTISNNGNSGFSEISSSLRLTIDAQVGDEIELIVGGVMTLGSSASETIVDAMTVVSGSTINRFGSGSRSGTWYVGGTTAAQAISGARFHTVVGTDLDTSNRVTVTLVGSAGSTTTLFANTTYDLNIMLKNLGPSDDD